MSLDIADSPARTAPPDEYGTPFCELSDWEQLDTLGALAARSSYWSDVLTEALAESDRIPALIAAALDPAETPAHVGTFLREILIEYAESVAAHRGDALEEL